MHAEAQVHLRGQADCLHKLVAASHIYDTWTAKGSDAAALAQRFLDGSIDLLDEFMTAPSSETHSSNTCSTDAQTFCTPKQQAAKASPEIIRELPSQSGSQLHTDGLPSGVCSAELYQPTLVQKFQSMPSQDVECPAATSEQQRVAKVAVLHKDNLNYQQFVENFMEPNLPVMIQGLADHWKATQEWVTSSGDIDIDFIAKQFGQAQVWVSDTTRVNAACAPRLDMTLAEFAEWWRMHKAGQDTRLLYLKDWHFAHEFPHYKAYDTPGYFQQDWLNEYYDMKQTLKKARCTKGLMTVQPASVDRCGCVSAAESAATEDGRPSNGNCTGDHLGSGEDTSRAHYCPEQAAGNSCQPNVASSQDDVVSSDYRFVYLGCKDTWTPLHADVLRSYSWSTNVAGRKHWKLLPPEYTHLVYDRFGREMAASCDLAGHEGRDRFPNLDQACRHVVECIQESGETIFVPSGWHHTVRNLEDTLSINHNWLNGYNMHWAWALLQQEHADATAAIEDCRSGCSAEEFEELVQRNMAANCGMNYAFMTDFMRAILSREMDLLRSGGECGEARSGHVFSVAKARSVLAKLQQQQSGV
ncbi:hypothetical protein ABBQ38_002528 [Trebouxia sp. C0009 RCD-2024]